MVRPVSADERRSTIRKVRLGTILLVGASAGLIGVQADAGLPAILGAVLAGMVTGGLLAWLALPSPGDIGDDDRFGDTDGRREIDDWDER